MKLNKCNFCLILLLLLISIVACMPSPTSQSTPTTTQSTVTPEQNFRFSVWVRDIGTNELIGQAKVYLSVGNQTIDQKVTDDSGQASFDVKKSYLGKDARFYAEHRKYYPNDLSVKLGDEDRTIITMTNRSVPKIDPDPPKPTTVKEINANSSSVIREKLETINIGERKTGKINQDQTIDYQFNADKNNPVLFTGGCSNERNEAYTYWLQIFNSQGRGLKEIELMCISDVVELPFTPPETGRYILRIRGIKFYGNYFVYFNPN